jgi:hypothetical protein
MRMSDPYGSPFSRTHDILASAARITTPSNLLLQLANANKASEFYLCLGYQIQAFDETLDQDHEVGIRLVTFGQAVTFYVDDIGYHDPSLILFHGTTEGGDRVMLVQHVSQISFLLIAMKRQNPEEPKKPFGFHPPQKEE